MAPASQQPSSRVTGNVGERGQAGVGQEGRCSKCDIGDEVSLEEAQQKMDPKGLYKWDADEFSMYCHPKEILGCFVRVSFRKCKCGLWTRKVGQNLQKNGCWTGFNKEKQCKNDFQARVRFIIGKERGKLFSVDDTESPAGNKRKEAPEREHLAEKRAAGSADASSLVPPQVNVIAPWACPPWQGMKLDTTTQRGGSAAQPNSILSGPFGGHPRGPTGVAGAQGVDSRPPQFPSHLSQQTTVSHSQQSPSSGSARQRSSDLKDALCVYPFTAAVLHYFFETEKKNLETSCPNFKTVQLTIRSISKSSIPKREQATMLFRVFQKLLPHMVAGEELSTVKYVIDYTFKVLLEVDGDKLELWDEYFATAKDLSTDEFVQSVEQFFESIIYNNVDLIELVDSLLPFSSFGIFFRMPSWLARLVLFIFKHNTAVQYRLMDRGYRSFAFLHGGATPQDLDSSMDGKEQVRYSIICGYNIGESPEGVGNITQEHRDIVERLSREYHQRFEAYQKEGEERWGEGWGDEDEDEDEAQEQDERDCLSLSPLLEEVTDTRKEDELAHAGTISPRHVLGFPPGSQAHFLKVPREDNAAKVEATEKAAAEAETDATRPLRQKEGLDSNAVGEAQAVEKTGVLDAARVKHCYSRQALTAAVEGAVAAVAAFKEREYLTLLASLTRLTTCRQSELEARDQETTDMLHKVRASTVKGHSTRGTRGGGASQGGKSEEMKEVCSQVLGDLHDFRDANGVWTSDWVLQVTASELVVLTY